MELEKYPKNILSAVRIIKGCLYIKKTINKKEKALSEDLYCQIEKYYSLIYSTTFWEQWIEDTSDLEKELNNLPKKMDEMKLNKEFKKENYAYLKKNICLIKTINLMNK